MFHKEIQSRWAEFTIHEQMANIGVEVGRVFSWKKKNKIEMSNNALYRSLELIDMTIGDKKNIKGLKELCRMREFLVDNFKGDNQYNFTETEWTAYFSPFLFAARNK